MSNATPIVIMFNQITDNVLQDLQNKGWVNPDGSPTGVVDFYISAAPFNLSLAKDSKTAKASTKVAAFVDAVTKAGHAYAMAPYGDVLAVLANHTLAKNSVIPFIMGVDEFVVKKSKETWIEVCKWLGTCGFTEAEDVAKNGTRILEALHSYVYYKGDAITEESYKTEAQDHLLGASWRERSENLSKFKFLRLFGASDKMLDAFSTAVVVSGGKSVELAHEARFVANFITLFKPTTEFKVGAISDILNFAAMLSGKPAIQNASDQDSVQVLQNFDEKSDVLPNIIAAYFDMEPDDVAALTAVKKLAPWVAVTRIYPSQDLADAAEAYLADKLKFNDNDRILIDPLLGNTRALTQVYLAKK